MFINRTVCGACGSHKKETLWSADFYEPTVWSFIEIHYLGRVPKEPFRNMRYELAACQECGFIWQLRVLAPNDMERLYETWIEPGRSLQKKRNANVLLYAGYASEVQCISKLLGRNPAEIKVLDFGMGWGFWCLMAKAFGYQVSGLEFSRERIEYGQSLGIEVIAYPELPKRKFDFINSDMVFEHLADPRDTLKILADSLTEGGIIRIAIPNGQRVERKLRNRTWKPGEEHLDPLEHISSFTRGAFLSMAASLGLEPIAPPLLIAREPGILPFVRTLVARLKKQFIGTTFYLRKTNQSIES